MISGGRAHVRATLYMGAIVAMRHNPTIKAFYDRQVERGKPKKHSEDCLRSENVGHSQCNGSG